MISFMKLSKFFLPLSAVLVAVSVVLFFVPGPNISIEFTGGTLMEIGLPADTTKERFIEVANAWQNEPPLGNVSVSATKNGSLLVRMRTISNDEHLALVAHLEKELGTLQELQYTTIGPTVGSTLKVRSLWALAIASAAILLYLTIAFRKVPKTLSPWAFGISAIITLVHDIVIVVGLFTILSHYTTFQLDTLFVTALLSTMGYSVSDTIVIFDRIRDNLFLEGKRNVDFEELADRSLRQSFTRTINTGLGALIMLCALFFFGSESLRWFILALISGTVIGTYSSYFIATPLLVYWKKRS